MEKTLGSGEEEPQGGITSDCGAARESLSWTVQSLQAKGAHWKIPRWAGMSTSKISTVLMH